MTYGGRGHRVQDLPTAWTMPGRGSTLTESRSWTAPDQEALVIRTIKNFKWEQSHWAEERRGDEKTKYTNGKLMDPRLESKGLGDSQLKEGPLAKDCSTKRTGTGIPTRGGRPQGSALPNQDSQRKREAGVRQAG